jgi:hypothetical protein
VTSQTDVIIALEADAHAQVVANRLEALGRRGIILDYALFPSQWKLTVHLSNDAPVRYVLEHNGTILNGDDVAGVWWRRPRQYIAPEPVGESHLRQFIVYESREAFEGWLHYLGNKVINPIGADLAGGHKLLRFHPQYSVGCAS